MTLAALVLRLTVFFLFQEEGGDGPSRAMMAYMWFKSPVLQPHAVWPPGYVYLAGLFNFFVSDPLISTRILNLILGTLTIPLMFFFIRRVFDNTSALLSATLLAVFPFHIGLSVTSLTEASFLLEVIAGSLLVVQAAATTDWRRNVYLIFSVFIFGLASLTRYEVWPLLPLFPAYYLFKTRKLYQSLILAAGLAFFPAVWMVNSYVEVGAILPAYDAALFLTEGGTNFIGAIKIIAKQSIDYIGWIIPVLSMAGVLFMLADATKGQLSLERLLYLAIFFVTGLFIVKFGMDRGTSLWLRYLLLLFVTIIPLSNFTISRYVGKKPLMIFLAVSIAAAPPFISQVLNKRELFVTQTGAHGVEALSNWLQNSTFKDSPILMTKIQWKATYIPLYTPEIAFRYIIVSGWLSDNLLYDFISIRQPQLLITSDNEEKYILRIEKILGEEIKEDRLIYNKDSYKVFDLRGLMPKTSLSFTHRNRCIPIGPDFLNRECQAGWIDKN